jgi:phosphate-selective porin OprO and OprP
MVRRSSVVVLLASFLAGSASAQQPVTPPPPTAPQAPPAERSEPAQPADPAAAPQTPEARIDELDQQLRILRRQIEIDKEAQAAAQATAPVVSAGPGGFEIRSADSAFRLRFRGYLNADVRKYVDDEAQAGTDGFLMRRARPIVDATLFKIFDIRLANDFGGGTSVLQDAYVDVRLSPRFVVRAGKQKAPLGQERLMSATDILFVERALPTALVPNRDVGVQLYGDLAPWLAYNIGLFNGVVDGGAGDVDTTDSKDVIGRVVLSPFKARADHRLQALAFGVGASGGREVGTAAAPALAQIRSGGQLAWFRFRSDGTAANTTVADGRRTRVTTFAQYYRGPLGLHGEYVRARHAVRRAAIADRIAQAAWQVTGSWVLTGETATGRLIAPRRAFDPSKGAWGAFEIVARANQLRVADAAFPVFANLDQAARRATAIGGGLNWYLNRIVKIAADYERTRFARGAVNGADRPAEHAVFTRLQVAF